MRGSMIQVVLTVVDRKTQRFARVLSTQSSASAMSPSVWNFRNWIPWNARALTGVRGMPILCSQLLLERSASLTQEPPLFFKFSCNFKGDDGKRTAVQDPEMALRFMCTFLDWTE
eukprot:TRINITY_DN38230_c0_g1_i2.p1 TRINITY_DN38230_c0_g1~~TRINITY_DN38230_c0_g1_i2.p1  ORF type:complete len:115 (+),score=9.82 TRINITY_DN38230_c0_g1_i2:202-546(+)